VVLHALLEDCCREVDLAVIGAPNDMPALASRLGLQNRVHFYGRLDDGEVGFLLSRSKALVMPSVIEGFALPPLEAARLGIPSICSDRPAMNEILRSAARFADADSPRQWAAEIHQMVYNTDHRGLYAQRAKELAEEFSWRRAGKELLEVLGGVADA
jgi:glycosyltransferase involved in cell wall biosynthesis